MPHAPSAPIEPSTGPASPTRASASAFFGICFIATNAPRKGMNIGADAGIPSRRNCTTWPISCTQIRTTNPIANHTGKSSAYAPTLSTIVRAVPRNLTFSARSASPLNLASNTPTTASGASRRLSALQSPPSDRGYSSSGRRSSRSLRKIGSLARFSPDGSEKRGRSMTRLYRPHAGPTGARAAGGVPARSAAAPRPFGSPRGRPPAGRGVWALRYLLQRPVNDLEPLLDLLNDGGVDLAVEYIPAHVAGVVLGEIRLLLGPGTLVFLRATQDPEQFFPQALQSLFLFRDEVIVKLGVGSHNSFSSLQDTNLQDRKGIPATV